MCTDESERLCKSGLGVTYCKKIENFNLHSEPACVLLEMVTDTSRSNVCYSVQIGLNFHLVCDIEK